MLQELQKSLTPSATDSLARAFARLGRLGFWMQIAIGAIPVALIFYAVVFGSARPAGTRSGFPLIQFLTIASLLVLAFTTVWFYRYTRIARRLSDPARRPTEESLKRSVCIGVIARAGRLVFSLLVMLFGPQQVA